MVEKVTPYSNEEVSKKQQVEQMFDNIAERYDFMNRFLSRGFDKGWRRKSIEILKDSPPKHVLDVATGTGDFAIMAAELLKPDKISGIDLSKEMLQIAKEKIKQKTYSTVFEFSQGDSEDLQFQDNTFDAATVAFGVRNFENIQQGLNEMHRVLKPGCKMVVLELTNPRFFLIRWIYNIYFHGILPLIARIFAHDRHAYEYLPKSVKAFPKNEIFLEMMQKAGFLKVSVKPLTLGVVTIFIGEK